MKYAIVLIAVVLLSACETFTVNLRQRSVGEYASELQRSSLTSPGLSAESQQVLRLARLDAALATSPAAVAKRLESESGIVLRWQRCMVAAEISFLLGQEAEQVSPRAAAGHYLDATLLAFEALFDDGAPADTGFDPRLTLLANLYDLAVGRFILVQQELAGPPKDWQPVTTARGVFSVRVQSGSPEFDPGYFDSFVPTSTLVFEGMQNRHRRYGFGSALVAERRGEVEGRPRHAFFPRKGEFHPVSATLVPARGADEGASLQVVTLNLFDSYATDETTVRGRRMVLAADFSAPFGTLLSRIGFNKVTQTGMFYPDIPAEWEGIYLLEPYDPKKIPIILVHGLLSTPMTWADAVNEFRRHGDVRHRYQIWVYTYPTLASVVYNCALFRRSLLAVREHFDPELDDPATGNIVLVSHSLGGLLAKQTIQTSGDRIWNLAAKKPLTEFDLTDEDRDFLQKALFFEPLDFVKRIVFMSVPHRGSAEADSFLAKFSKKLVQLPPQLLALRERVLAKNRPALTAASLEGPLTGLDTLAPDNEVLRQLGELEMASGVPYHTIIGTLDSTVANRSSKLEGAVSEMSVESGHNTNHHPEALAEVVRILREHAAR